MSLYISTCLLGGMEIVLLFSTAFFFASWAKYNVGDLDEIYD